MSNLDKLDKYNPGRFEWGLFFLDIILLLLLAVRIISPLFLDGQLLPSMAFAFLPGAVLTLLKRPSLSVHRMCFALGLMVFLVANGTIKPSEIAEAMKNWPWVTVGIIALCLQILTGAWRWVILLGGQGIGLSFLTSVRLLTVGYFFNTFIPGATGGDFYRIYKVAKGNRGLVAPVTATVFLDRFLGLPTLLVMILAGICINFGFISSTQELYTVAKGYGVLTVCSVLFFVMLFLAAFYLADKLRSYSFTGFIGRALVQAVEAIEVYKNSKKTLLYVVLISIISNFGTLFSFLCFARAVGIEGTHFSLMLFLVFAGLMVNFIPLAPGGAGQGELAFSWIFAVATPGFPENAHRAAVMMLCYRLGMLVYGGVGGLIYAFSKQEVEIEKDTICETKSAS